MGSPVIPPLPPGFTLDSRPAASSGGGGGLPPLPPGFRLDSAPAPSGGGGFLESLTHFYRRPEDPDPAIGFVKGVGNTVAGLGSMVHSIPGVSGAMDAVLGQPGVSEASFARAREVTVPSNPTEAAAMGVEQAAEFIALPGPAKVRGALRVLEAAKTGASAAGLARAQGASEGGVLTTGVLSAVPVAEGVMAAGRKVGEAAAPLVRAAIKPTVSAMKKVAGASVEGIEAKANQLVSFIIQNRVTTAEKARTIVTEAERELQRVLSTRNAPTDAPQRAVRYLEAVERQAAKQGLPATDVAILRNAAAEVLESGLGKDVVTMVPTPHPTLVQPNGQPFMVMTPQISRALRTDVTATEALERARATSRWETRKAWGEQKGAQLEASKAVERAARDSVKAAVPEAVPILQRQGMGIRAADVLDRAEFRAANRDAVSLPAHVIAAGEVATGRVPVMAFAANWLRNNQLRAGVWADDLGKAINNNDTGRVVSILHRLGVASTAQASVPAGAR